MNVQATYQYIVKTDGISGGKPRIEGHRITVQNIVIWYEQMGYSVDEIATEYDLKLSEVHAALAYYYDHQDEIKTSIAEDEAFVESMREQSSGFLRSIAGMGSSAERDLSERDEEVLAEEIDPIRGWGLEPDPKNNV